MAKDGCRWSDYRSIGLVIALFAVGCSGNGSGEPIAEEHQETRCGTTYDWQDVEFYDGSDSSFDAGFVARYQGAFGMYCSGTLISQDIFITVAHCTPGVGGRVGFNCQLDGTQSYPPMTTQAEVDAANAAAAARCDYYTVSDVLYLGGSGDPDIAVLRLDGTPGATYGWITPSNRVPTGEEVAVFQHPQMRAGAYRRKVVSFGPLVGSNSTDLDYSADTYGGSSGAGVLDAMGRLVAVHRASGCTDTGGYNAGTKMGYIISNVQPVAQVATSVWQSPFGPLL